MKKPENKGKKGSAAAKPAKRKANPPKLDLDALEGLRQLLESALAQEGDEDGESSVELIERFLDICRGAEEEAGEKEDLLQELLPELSALRIAVAHDEPGARAELDEILELIGDAIDEHELALIDLMLASKLFAEAGFAVPDRLKQALADTLSREPTADGEEDDDEDGEGETSLADSLLSLAEAVGNDPFEMYEQLRAFLAGFPQKLVLHILIDLGARGDDLTLQALAGFLLHADAEIAATASESLAAAASKTPVESRLVERIVRMRPWLAPERHPPLDAAIKALRQNTLAPVKSVAAKASKIYLSVCDGAGAHGLLAAAKTGRSYTLASALMTPAGVTDAFVHALLSKREVETLVREASEAAKSEPADAAVAGRMLALALADNVRSATPPPYKLIEVAEILGLGPLPPDSAAPETIAGELLAELPADWTDANAAKRAHTLIAGELFPESWFEDGGDVDKLLRPVRGVKARVEKLLTGLMPARRGFWARQCALTALALRGLDAQHPPAACLEFALVARDLASDKPAETVPLLKRLAEESASVFAARTGK